MEIPLDKYLFRSTAHKMKFSIKDSFSKSTVSYGIGRIYLRNCHNCLTNQNANTFQSLLFQQIHFNQIKSKVDANNTSNVHFQMFFQLYTIAAG